MPLQLSLPRDRISVLLLEGISQRAVDYFSSCGYTNLVHLPKALDDQDLKSHIADAHIIGIRSRTHLTEEIFESARKLIAVGCFSVGTNQVNLEAARRRGIPVFNAPYSNTRSVAELVIGEIIMLTRQIFPRSVSAHQGGWEKSAEGSREVRGKTLGIAHAFRKGAQLRADIAVAEAGAGHLLLGCHSRTRRNSWAKDTEQQDRVRQVHRGRNPGRRQFSGSQSSRRDLCEPRGDQARGHLARSVKDGGRLNLPLTTDLGFTNSGWSNMHS